MIKWRPCTNPVCSPPTSRDCRNPSFALCNDRHVMLRSGRITAHFHGWIPRPRLETAVMFVSMTQSFAILTSAYVCNPEFHLFSDCTHFKSSDSRVGPFKTH